MRYGRSFSLLLLVVVAARVVQGERFSASSYPIYLVGGKFAVKI